MNSNGAIIYEGPSILDGAPIVVIATGLQDTSDNAKTGNMVQTWILLADVDPVTAAKSGQDESVCGDCKHRPVNLGTCYVTLWQAPLGVWKAYQRGSYDVAGDLAEIGRDRKVRLGSYGDPAAVPVHVWNSLLTHATDHTGYTHQWMRDDTAELADICMASVDTPEELEMAQSLDFLTFRVRTEEEPLIGREGVCPASKEAGNILTCATCKACGGKGTGRKGSKTIIAHGIMARRFNQLTAGA